MLTFEQLNERIKTLSDEVNMRKLGLEDIQGLLENAIEVDNVAAKITIFAALGQYHYYQGDTQRSFEYMFDAYTLASELDNPEALIKAQSNLGAVYVSLGLYEHAFQYLMMALKGVEHYDLKEKVGVLYINIGSCLFKQEMVEASGDYFKQAYEMFMEQGNPYYRLFTILNMVAFTLKVGNLDSAEAYLLEAQDLRNQLPPTMQCGIDSSFARLKAYRGDLSGSIEDMNRIMETYFTKQVELILYDQILDWVQVLEQCDSIDYAKEILIRTIDQLKDDRSAVTGELMMTLANLYEAEGLFEEAAKLFKTSVEIKSEQYKKNQQFITENTLKLIELTKKNHEIAQKSLRDGLTGCLNRHALDMQGQKLLDQYYEEGRQVAVIMFDIDYFKQYNDYYGHLQGDQCITSITKAVMKVFPDEKRYFYRYGGDEFLLIWPLKHSGESIASALLDVVRAMQLTHEKSLTGDSVTISIGVSTMSEHNWSLRNAIDAADMNLYKAKFHQRNCASVDEQIVK